MMDNLTKILPAETKTEETININSNQRLDFKNNDRFSYSHNNLSILALTL